MAFKQVFYALREVFPQVDLRILKAVASEYSSDVDAAVEFVLSDVLPAVSEPMEAQYTLHDIDYIRNDHANSWNSCAFCERNQSGGCRGPLCTNKKLDEYSHIEEKVVINETVVNPTVYYHQVESSSTSASKPPIKDYECCASKTFVNHCAIEKGKMITEAQPVANQKHFNGNYNLPDFLVSSQSILPLYTQGPSDCAVKYQGAMPLKLPKAESTQAPELQDNYNLEHLFANFRPTEDDHAPVNFLDALTAHTLCESEDNYDLRILFQNEMPLKLSEAETVCHLSKSEDNYNLDTLFVEFCSNEDRGTSDSLPSVPTFEKHSESEDTYGLQVLYENIDSVGKELDTLHTAESTPELHKSEDDLHRKPCTANSTTQVPRFLIDELKRAEKEIMYRSSMDKHSFVPVIVHDTFLCNETKLMPRADKYEEFLDTTKSYQIAGINKLVSDITNSKEALISLYDSTTTQMKEVELQEESSTKAKEDAIKARQDFVSMVENFHQLIQNSRDSNDKQAQILREEESLLEILAQDLQSRLTKLSAERDEAFRIIEEVKFELDTRLATSIEEEAAAREQISQKEKLALLVRKEKEAKLGSIMEESTKLQKEAEENILLRGFLSDCGRTIDILQGEISSIHEKVVALKERTQRSKLESALVTTSSSATSFPTVDCKTALPDKHWPLKNRNDSGTLPQGKMVKSHAEDHEFSDDGWEMLETTEAYN